MGISELEVRFVVESDVLSPNDAANKIFSNVEKNNNFLEHAKELANKFPDPRDTRFVGNKILSEIFDVIPYTPISVVEDKFIEDISDRFNLEINRSNKNFRHTINEILWHIGHLAQSLT